MKRVYLRNIFLLLSVTINCSLTKQGEDQKQVVCENINDIRSYTDLDFLNNCTIVVGNVNLILGAPGTTDDYTRKDINSRTFPLREVTGFMLLHTLQHLDSLSTLFPNLTIIRGLKLFSNYALIIYDTELKEIGLNNLLRISRGSVRIDGSNSNLCLPKIDWKRINPMGKLFIGKNSTSFDCPTLPECKKCPQSGFCWSSQKCQKFDEPTKNKPCHRLCLGSNCVNNTAEGCFVCRDMSEDFKCVESCSSQRLLNGDSRKCISADNCKKLNRKIYDRECLKECPAGFETQFDESNMMDMGECKPCENKCPKICNNLPEIRTVAQLEAIGTGCTIINGSLEINIIEDVSNLTAELQTYLGEVEEIHGNIKIHRSNAITTLTFLNELRFVGGSGTGSKSNASSLYYSVRIFDNQNLQNLFDWRTRGNKTLTIKSGSVMIYNNIRLCENEVINFKKLINGGNRTEDYMTKNGYQNNCMNEDIKTYFSVISHDECEIFWTDMSSNSSNFPGYMIQYMAIDEFGIREANENIFYERDSCSQYGWNNVIVKRDEVVTEDGKMMKFKLQNLTQYTTYAFTVQLYHWEIEVIKNNSGYEGGGPSEVQIFHTKMRRPTRVLKFTTVKKSFDSITLSFDVLQNEKSAINTFLLHVYEQKISTKIIDQRDYCDETIESEDSENSMSTKEEDENSCCEKCCKNQKQVDVDDSFTQSLIEFSRESELRESFQDHRMKMEKLDGFISKFDITGTSRNFTVKKLKPLSFYRFHIYACSKIICSEYELHLDRTTKNEDEEFDRVRFPPSLHGYINGTYFVSFDEPLFVNGAILSYTIELREIFEKSDNLLLSKCISRKQHTYMLEHLKVGSYSIRVRATSLGGPGHFSEFHYFHIEQPQKEASHNYILVSICIILVVLVSAFTAYYFKHRILTILNRFDDSAMLIEDDSNQVSMSRVQLSDIMENDE